jgi:hypothetical protein
MQKNQILIAQLNFYLNLCGSSNLIQVSTQNNEQAHHS